MHNASRPGPLLWCRHIEMDPEPVESLQAKTLAIGARTASLTPTEIV